MLKKIDYPISKLAGVVKMKGRNIVLTCRTKENELKLYLSYSFYDSAIQYKHVFTILKTFGSKSGCKVNLSKSCAFY